MTVTSGPYAPPGPPVGPPPAPPAPPTPWWRSRSASLALSVVLITTAAVAFLVARSSTNASAGEVFRAAKDVPGSGAFTPSFASPTSVTPEALADLKPNDSGIAVFSSDAAGLYAGERNVPSCDATQLVNSLASAPRRARAWAGAVGIDATQIGPFVATLTSAVLRADTRVTDYQFVGDAAKPRQSVLQAGTAVMLDRTGFPRVRCQSGNPLGEPTAVSSSPSYAGPRWSSFNPRRVVVVRPATATRPFLLLDSKTGSIFLRIPGGIADVNQPPTGVTIQLCEPGQPFGVTGSRFPAGSPITLTWDNPPVTLANVTADGGGNFSEQVTCPPGAAVGTHQVTATGGGFTLAQPVYVIPPAPPPRRP